MYFTPKLMYTLCLAGKLVGKNVNVSIQIYASAMTQLYHPAITNGVLFDLFHTHQKMIAGVIHISACQEGHEHAIWVEFSSSIFGNLVGKNVNVSIQLYASDMTQLYPAITNGVLFDLFHFSVGNILS